MSLLASSILILLHKLDLAEFLMSEPGSKSVMVRKWGGDVALKLWGCGERVCHLVVRFANSKSDSRSRCSMIVDLAPLVMGNRLSL
jgi:hypothetical protein